MPGTSHTPTPLASNGEGRWPRICESPSRDSLRVALLSYHTSPLAAIGRSRDAGGMNVYIRELARHLAAAHVQVDCFTRWTDPDLPQILPLADNARIIHIPAGPLTPVHKNDLFALAPHFVAGIECFAISNRLDYDLLHSHYWLSGVAGMSLSRRWGAPHVTMFHTLARLKQQARPEETEPPLRIEQERQIIANVDGIIVATEDERQQISRLYGLPAQAMHTIPCGVDLDRFDPAGRQTARHALANTLGIAHDVPLLLFVGRLDPLKGPDLLIRMMAILRTYAHLVILGGDEHDPERARLRQLADELGVASQVHLLDAVPQDQLPIYYRAADLLTIASHYESFGLVAVEAMACGTPVIAPAVGGLPVIVREGINGALVSQRSPLAFADRVDSLLSDPARYARLAHYARASVTRFSWPVIAAQVVEVYRDALAQPVLAVVNR